MSLMQIIDMLHNTSAGIPKVRPASGGVRPVPAGVPPNLGGLTPMSGVTAPANGGMPLPGGQGPIDLDSLLGILGQGDNSTSLVPKGYDVAAERNRSSVGANADVPMDDPESAVKGKLAANRERQKKILMDQAAIKSTPQGKVKYSKGEGIMLALGTILFDLLDKRGNAGGDAAAAYMGGRQAEQSRKDQAAGLASQDKARMLQAELQGASIDQQGLEDDRNDIRLTKREALVKSDQVKADRDRALEKLTSVTNPLDFESTLQFLQQKGIAVEPAFVAQQRERIKADWEAKDKKARDAELKSVLAQFEAEMNHDLVWSGKIEDPKYITYYNNKRQQIADTYFGGDIDQVRPVLQGETYRKTQGDHSMALADKRYTLDLGKNDTQIKHWEADHDIRKKNSDLQRERFEWEKTKPGAPSKLDTMGEALQQKKTGLLAEMSALKAQMETETGYAAKKALQSKMDAYTRDLAGLDAQKKRVAKLQSEAPRPSSAPAAGAKGEVQSLKSLGDRLVAEAGGKFEQFSDGPRDVVGSPGVPSKHSDGRAIDYFNTPEKMASIADSLVKSGSVSYLIYNKRAWSPSKGWHAYEKPGSDPHTSHIHIEMSGGGGASASPKSNASDGQMDVKAERKKAMDAIGALKGNPVAIATIEAKFKAKTGQKL